MIDTGQDSELLITQFNRLINELLRGSIHRNCFRPWEVELLLDMEACNLHGPIRRELLRRYQKAVQRRFERGQTELLRLSEYLRDQRQRGQVLASS